jgi:hypothetical protein
MVLRKLITKISTLLCFVLIISGCAGMADSMDQSVGLGVITEDISTFDNSKTISVSPTWFAKDKDSWGAAFVKLGAAWTDKYPESVTLLLKHESSITSGTSYLNINNFSVNLNGEITTFNTSSTTSHESSNYNSVSKDIYTESSNAVVIPLNYLRQMVNSDNCRLRIDTSAGLVEGIFSMERTAGGARTALASIKEFLTKVDSTI